MKFLSRLNRTRPPPWRRPEAPDISSTAPRDRFDAFARALGADARVLEVGTKRAAEKRSTQSHWKFPNVPRENYVMADISLGTDVDVIADLHALPEDWTGRFNAFVAIAVFEHLERPWIAAKEVERILAPGGACFIATHQTYPLHGFPSDFFRFSKEALSLVFEDAGLRVVETAYRHRCTIQPPTEIVPRDMIESWNRSFPSYINVHLMAVKGSGVIGAPAMD